MSGRYHTPVYFFVMSFLFQLVGLGVGLFSRHLMLTALGEVSLASLAPLPAFIGLGLHAFAAYLLAGWFKLPGSWRLCNLFLAPAALLCIQYEIAPELLLIPLVIAAAIFAPTFWTRVPFYPTSKPTYRCVADLLPAQEGVKFIDIGSGFGGLLLYLARQFPAANFAGVEISPLPLFVSKVRALIFRAANVKFCYTNFWQLSLANYDVVYAFLSPAPMERLWEKVQREMRPGTLFISNSFPVSQEPDRVVEVAAEGGRQFTLYIYKIN